jgi:hypothetical protein
VSNNFTFNSFEEALKKVATNPDPSVYTTMDNTGATTRYNRYANTGVEEVNKFTDESNILSEIKIRKI